MLLLPSLLLACGSKPEYQHSACLESEFVYQGSIWRTQAIEDRPFLVGHGLLAAVDEGELVPMTPPMENVEQTFLWQGELWASDWGAGLAVCRKEGWELVETPPPGGESSDQMVPGVLREGLAMMGSYHPDPDCMEGDCSPGYQVFLMGEEGEWEVLASGGARKWTVVDGRIWARFDEGWSVLEEGSWAPVDPAPPHEIWAHPDQDWLLGRGEDGLWWEGPWQDLRQIEGPSGQESGWRDGRVTAPGDYLLSDRAGTWRYQDGAWTALPLVEGSVPMSAAAGPEGVMVIGPPQWVGPEGAVELEL